MQLLLLRAASREPGESGSEQIRVRSEPAGSSDQIRQGLARVDAVAAGSIDFASNAHKRSMLFHWQLMIGPGKDGNDVPWLQRLVVERGMIVDSFGKPERNE